MTTIAWDGNLIASDSQATGDFICQENTRKIYRLENGAVVAFCGSVENAMAFLEWINSPKKKKSKYPSDLDDFAALVFIPGQKKALEYGSRPVAMEVSAPYALGSGGSYAMAAMLAGVDAAEAVSIACKLDPFSRGPVRKYEIPKKH